MATIIVHSLAFIDAVFVTQFMDDQVEQGHEKVNKIKTVL